MIFHENTRGALRPGERRTENGACSAEGANLPRLQNAPAGRPTNLHPKALLRAHPLRFCGFPGKALKAPQEMQEIQEMQERAASARQAKPFPNFQWSVLRAVARPKSALICEICGSMEGVA